MNEFEMVPLIVLFVMSAVIVMRWISAKERIAKARGMNDAADARIKALEERVKVLERIATDKRTKLRDEIDALSD
ncbi:hypothetical protein [Kordiimonas sp.]|uniref:hypothetical protein n=1 Tax=Kordiimonas sp. TaxID=1970157 RepID=UPI003A92A1B9